MARKPMATRMKEPVWIVRNNMIFRRDKTVLSYKIQEWVIAIVFILLAVVSLADPVENPVLSILGY